MAVRKGSNIYLDKANHSSLFRRVQLARKFPDIGQVRVDRMGNIIGGVNPFEDTDVKLEDQPHPEDQEVGAYSSTNHTSNLHYCSCRFYKELAHHRAVGAHVDIGLRRSMYTHTSTTTMFWGDSSVTVVLVWYWYGFRFGSLLQSM